MAKGNDKKLARESRDLLVAVLGNLLQGHRERKSKLSRTAFFAQKTPSAPTAAFVETGRLLRLTFQPFRLYLATVYGKNDAAFVSSARKVYDGLKELDKLLEHL
jgi:hypothetical protein